MLTKEEIKTSKEFREIQFQNRPKSNITNFVWLFIAFVLVAAFSFIVYNQTNSVDLEQQKQENRLQTLINKIYFSAQLTASEQAEFCELLFKIKGVSLENCEKLTTDELLNQLTGSDVKYKATVGKSTTTDYKKTFFDAYPELINTVVVHHAIEQDVLNKYPDLFLKYEIHSLENLRGIPIEKNNVLHLSKIRKEWNRFYRKYHNPTREQILDKATDIDNKYGNQFKPNITSWKQ